MKFGFDIGSNSIGWAVVSDKSESILDAGVLVFQEGVNHDTQGKELSRNVSRREYRQIRRQIFRRKIRLVKLIRTMQLHGLCPNDDGLNRWFEENPYHLRAIAINNQISLEQLGRIFFHLAKRRGFKSSRKGGDKETKLDTTDIKSGRIGTKETHEKLKESRLTLGAYFYSILRKDGEPYTLKERIRNRVYKRELIEEEFEQIWEHQKPFYPDVLTDELKEIYGNKKTGILFFKRPLKSQKHLIGRCRYETNKAKCPKSRTEFEEFRTLQLLNNFKFDDDRLLTDDERTKALEYINSKSKSIKLDDLVKHLKIDYKRVNYDIETKIPANTTTYLFNKLLEDRYFDVISSNEIHKVLDKIWLSLYTSTDSEKMVEYLLKNFGGISEKSMKLIVNTNLNDDYAELSLKAINNILPFMRMGLKYNVATLLGGIKNAFGSKWDELDDNNKSRIVEYIKVNSEATYDQGLFINYIKSFLRDEFGLDEKHFKKLYHHSADTEERPILDKLPLPEDLRNPIVNKALYELRKLVHYMMGEYGKPEEIRIEFARKLKIPKKNRKEILKKNRENEAKNQRAIEFLEQNGLAVNRTNIQKYRLFTEIENRDGIAYCIYSGKPISKTDLFAPDNRIEVDHIVPYSFSLDDSMSNKVICDRDYNHGKSNRTPFQWLSNTEKWDSFKDRAIKLFWKNDSKSKLRKLISTKDPDIDGFIQRQMNDTHYIAREAKEYLRTICPIVNITQGTVTAILRRYWNLNSILDPANDEKNRKDNRHHAIDAIVVACSKNSYLQILSTQSAQGSKRDINVPMPWENFREDVVAIVDRILIKFSYRERVLENVSKIVRKNGLKFRSKGLAARGELHAQTFYGRRKAPDSTDFYFHIRKSLNDIDNYAKFEKIVDPKIKELVRERLKEIGFGFNKKDKIPPNTFFDIDKDSNLVTPKIWLKNKRGEQVPVFKVRIKEVMSNAIAIYNDINKWVDPSNNYCIALYRNDNGKIFEKVVTFWEAVERKLQKMPIIAPHTEDRSKLFAAFKKNDMYLLGLSPDRIEFEFGDKKLFSKHLYRVQKLSSWDYVFRHHTASTIEYGEQMKRIVSEKGLLSQNPIKVIIDTGGNIRRAQNW